MKRAIELLQQGEAGTFAFDERPLTLSDIDELLVGTGLRFPTFRLVRGGETGSPDEVCQAPTDWGVEQVGGLVRPEEVHRKLREGWTLVLDQLHRQWGGAARLNRAFEVGLSARSRVDVLVAPDGATPPDPEALDRAILVLAGEAGIVVDGTEQRVPAGQGVTVPKGAQASFSAARGLTLVAAVVVSRVTWREVLMEALSACDHPSWHDAAAIDAHGAKTLDDTESAQWDQVVDALVDGLDAEDALERIASRLVRSRMPILTRQFQMQAADIDDNTPLRRRPEILYRIVVRGQETFLLFHSRELKFGVGARRVLELMAEAPLFRPGDLPGIPVEQRIPLCSALVRAGFLTLDVG